MYVVLGAATEGMFNLSDTRIYYGQENLSIPVQSYVREKAGTRLSIGLQLQGPGHSSIPCSKYREQPEYGLVVHMTGTDGTNISLSTTCEGDLLSLQALPVVSQLYNLTVASGTDSTIVLSVYIVPGSISPLYSAVVQATYQKLKEYSPHVNNDSLWSNQVVGIPFSLRDDFQNNAMELCEQGAFGVDTSLPSIVTSVGTDHKDGYCIVYMIIMSDELVADIDVSGDVNGEMFQGGAGGSTAKYTVRAHNKAIIYGNIGAGAALMVGGLVWFSLELHFIVKKGKMFRKAARE